MEVVWEFIREPPPPQPPPGLRGILASLGVLSVVLGSPLLLVLMTPFSKLTFKHLR